MTKYLFELLKNLGASMILYKIYSTHFNYQKKANAEVFGDNFPQNLFAYLVTDQLFS